MVSDYPPRCPHCNAVEVLPNYTSTERYCSCCGRGEGRQYVYVPGWWYVNPHEIRKLPPYKKPPAGKEKPRFYVEVPPSPIPKFVSRRLDWMKTLQRRG